ncbi:thiamine diphosphokinase [Salipiger sp. IMCC34102]|uniref:thiamine diphosphokinase n=1 Tax=Salipiger sp. IMCC34102 TaxID=2510647 RepID=UPI0013EAE930|nr:thiamine diphosphokinase [Salipiger sp. IMCC34102]
MTLVGGGKLGPDEVNTCLARAPTLVAADGGADVALRAGLVPVAVIGDLDSLSQAARSAFADRLHAVEAQDTTDFEKCLQRVKAPLVLAAGFLGGRLDHTLSTLSVLARLRAHHVVLVGEDQVVVLARRGRSRIVATPGRRVALLPLGEAVVSSDGLVWDMDAMALAADGQVSSSNGARSDLVTLDVQGPVLITLEPADLDFATDYALGR